MKKSKLLVLSLLAIGAIGLTSCGQGPQGEKGETGAPGEKGETGAPGKDGTDGENGKNVLNGEGAPKDTEGVDGDSYIDYSSFDYYVKESGKWVKKGNLKGAKGDTGATGEKGETGAKGEKGETGSTGGTGSRGPQGETAWSSTILPTVGGYVTVNLGSAVEGTTVTFTIHADDDYELEEFKLNDKDVEFSSAKVVDGKYIEYTASAEMEKYGFVVSATFKESELTLFENGYVSEEQSDAAGNKVYSIHPNEGYTVISFSPDGEKTYNVGDFSRVEGTNWYEFTSKSDSNIYRTNNVNGIEKMTAVFKEFGEDDYYYDSDNDKFYETLDEVLSVTRECDVANLILYRDDEISETKIYNNKGTIKIILGDVNLHINEKMYLINTSLTFEGNGKIVSEEDNALFGLYGGFKYSKTSTKAVETKLEIGENIKTESKYENVASIYSKADGIEDYALTDNGTATATDKLTFNFKGKDTSSWYGIVYVNGDLEKSDEIPVINIDKASSTGSNWIAGYAELNVTNSEFNVVGKGSAFTINAGKVKFENNKFVNDHAKANGPDYTYDAGDNTTFDGNAVIWMTDNLGTFAGYTTAKSIDSAEFKNNTFSYGDGKDRPEGYYNIGLYGDDKVTSGTIVTPTFTDGSGQTVNASDAGYNGMKRSDMKARIWFDYEFTDEEGETWHSVYYCYFKDAEKADAYTTEQFIKDYNIEYKITDRYVTKY